MPEVKDEAATFKLSLQQWRESLINLTNRNRLINYRPTRASTIEFDEALEVDDIFRQIAQEGGCFVRGTRPERPLPVSGRIDSDDDEPEVDESSQGNRATFAEAETTESLEDRVLDELNEFEYAAGDGLSTDKTQREVNRTLKRLAGDARREFVDKGLTVLYVAFGLLDWIDEKGEARVSPLILIPASLVSDGPHQPHRLLFSEDESAVNPALGLKALEFGVQFPTVEEIEGYLGAGEVSIALDVLRRVAAQSGWSVRERAVLANFMFAKEAMYRDLLDNEELVLSSELVAALPTVSSRAETDFGFDPIDESEIDRKAPAEQVPLILDADSSQRAAIAAAVSGKSFTLDGPPGTGKSQTIANIIGALLGAGKSVLFVSEKAVALDVVRDRLGTRGLGSFLLELHSHKATRSEVAAELGRTLLNKVSVQSIDAALPQAVERKRIQLNSYAAAMNEVREPLRLSVFEALGRTERLGVVLHTPDLGIDPSLLTRATLDEAVGIAGRLASSLHLERQGESAIWFGLETELGLDYKIDELQRALAALEVFSYTIDPIVIALGVASPRDLSHVSAVISTWREKPEVTRNEWTVEGDLVSLRASLERYTMSAKQWRAARDHAVDLASARWREVGELQDAETLFSSERVKTLTGSSSANLATIRDARHRLSSHAQELRGLVEQLNRLVGIWGFNPPAGATEAVGMLDNIVEGRSWSELPDLWLTTEGIATARSTATVLKQALEAERLAQQAAAPLFTAAALDVNLSEIERTLTENSGALSRFKADFKAARNELEAVSQPGSDWRSVAREIPRARYWRECLDFRSGREAELAAYLGGHYAGFDTDWQSIQDKLAVAEQCVATIDGFANRAEFVFGMRGAEPTNYDQANYLATGLRESEAPDSFATIVSKRSDDDRMLAHAERWLSEFEAVAGQVVDIDRAQAAIRSAWTARTAHDNLLSAAGETAADLGVAVDERDESVEMIESSLDWVERFRGVISSGPGHLTNAVLEALNNAEIGTGVETIVNDWESAKVAFQQSFSERRVQLFQEDFSSIDTSRALIDDLKSAAQEREVWNSFQRDRQAFLELGLERALTYTQRFDVAPSQFAAVVEFMMVKAWLDWALRSDERFSIGGAESRDELAQSFRKEDAQLSDISVGRIIEVLNDRRPKTTRGQASIIQRESEKKKRHVPVRQLMSEARDVISALKPCFMMSPLAVSQYLPPDMKFDVVIFDEASQVLPADAINCIYRGRALITAGDQKQLPPTSFFTSSSDDDDDLAEEENAALDFESILDLMKSSGNFTSLTLNWHYRSRHEQLISYSNTSFYSNRLITFPGAIADSPDLGVKFYAVDGVYKRGAGRDNPIEAQAVARRVIEHFKTRPGKSLGVITFSASQRDTVGNAVELERAKHPELNDFFEEDRVDGFFIKSIESVQGDERDVIIFSIGYGPDESGQTYQNFGALNKAGGERRLNVAITRARELVEVVSSMSSSLIKDGTNEGTRHLRRYLDFAERGEAALAMELGPSGLGTDSPFEDAVIDAIRGWGFEVQPQVGVAGFRIDIGVKHPNLPGAFMLGVECDGAMYHSSRTARDRDRLRHDILEGLGWHLHHIWGTDWYRNREREADRLHQVLETFAAMPTVGRGTARDVNPSMLVDSAPTYGALFSADIGFTKPPWTKEYQVSRPSVPYIFDWADPTSSSLLIPAINEIVRVESPLHREVLNTRIREITGVGRVGARIQSAIDRAISKSEARIDGDFLLSTKTTTVVVRTPWTDARPIEHIHTEELSNALIGVIEDSVGTDKVQAIAGVCSIFAWQRTGARIRDRLESILDSLIALGKVQESVTGALTIKASSL